MLDLPLPYQSNEAMTTEEKIAKELNEPKMTHYRQLVRILGKLKMVEYHLNGLSWLYYPKAEDPFREACQAKLDEIEKLLDQANKGIHYSQVINGWNTSPSVIRKEGISPEGVDFAG